jgi:hypothetical protein
MSRGVAVLLSAAPREAGSLQSKNFLAHAAGEHKPPELKAPSDASRHCPPLQHEHMQSSLPPQGGGGGQALESSNLAMTLPGDPSGTIISFADRHLPNSVEHVSVLHDSGDLALKEKCTYTLSDAGQPGQKAASQQEQSQFTTSLHGSGGGGGDVGGRSTLTLTLIFWPYPQWSHVACPPR